MTAVILFALAVLHAEMRIKSSIRRSFGSLNGAGWGFDVSCVGEPGRVGGSGLVERDWISPPGVRFFCPNA